MIVLTARTFTGSGTTRHTSIMPAEAVKSIQEAISAYWRDPYTQLGFLRALNHAKSHPGRYYPDHRLQSESDF